MESDGEHVACHHIDRLKLEQILDASCMQNAIDVTRTSHQCFIGNPH